MDGALVLARQACDRLQGRYAHAPWTGYVASDVIRADLELRLGEKVGPIEFQEGTPDTQADRALARFTTLVARFAEEDEPFRSLVHPMWRARYGDYDHLARVKEWRAAEDDIGDAG